MYVYIEYMYVCVLFIKATSSALKKNIVAKTKWFCFNIKKYIKIKKIKKNH